MLLAVLLLLGASQLASATTLTDVTGRTIEIDTPVERFIVSEGRYVSTLALLQAEDPFAGLIGMMSSVGYYNPTLEAQLFEKFPHGRDVALFGSGNESSVSVEKIIELQPQVAIFGAQDHGPGSRNVEMLQQLKDAGIEVLFIDFRSDPLNNTVPSIKLLGKLLGREKVAKRYTDLYQQKLLHVRNVAAAQPTRPTVFLQAHPGRMPCCRGMADGMLGPFIGVSGGENIADAVAPGPTSAHSAEFLLVENPDVWIGTASGSLAELQAHKSPVAAGPGVNTHMASESLARYLADPSLREMDAVKQGRAHSIWHSLYNSPLNIIALEAFAKWIHPAAFAELDPAQTAADIHRDFLPYAMNGAYISTAPKP